MTPRDVLERLAVDPSPDLQAAARRQLETPGTALYQEATDLVDRTEGDDSSAISGDIEPLTRLAQSSRAANRVLAAQHENTPLSLLSALASDSDASVRAAVASNTAAITHWASRRRSDEGSVGEPANEVASTPTARDDHEEIWRIPLEGIEDVYPLMWMSPTGRWLAVREFASDNGELVVIDVEQAQVAAKFPLSEFYSAEYMLDVTWCEDESLMSILECSYMADADDDPVPLQVIAMNTMSVVVTKQLELLDSFGWGVSEALGTRFDQHGLRLTVDFATPGRGGGDHAPYGFILINIPDAQEITREMWAPPGCPAVMNADMTRCYLVVDRQYMVEEGPTRFAVWICDLDLDTYRVLELGSDPVLGAPWLSDDEQTLYVELSESSRILEIDVGVAEIVRGFDSTGFEPPTRHLWSISRRHNHWSPEGQPFQLAIESPDGRYAYAVDQTSQSLIATRLATTEESSGVIPANRISDKSQSSRRVIPLELPND